MESEAFQQWGKLFTKEVREIWCKEQTEFKIATMLLFVLKREFNNLLCNLDDEYGEIKLKYNNVKEEKNATDKVNCNNDESTVLNSPPALKSIENISFNKDDLFIESSDDTICPSPKLSRQKHYKRKKPKLFKTDDVCTKSKLKLDLDKGEECVAFHDNSPTQLLSQQHDIIDCTMINGTPNVTGNSKRGRYFLDCSKKRNVKKNKKSFQNNTLTQMLFNSESISKETNKIDDSRCADKNSVLLKNPFISTKTGTTKDVNSKPPNEIVCKDPVVRGKERLKLEGWDCEECEKFYGALDLNSQEAKKLLNKCSKHRATRKPTDYTIPGYWTLSFTQTQEKKERELEQHKTEDSTFFQF
nr:uncharacterized protein LOC111419123 [Onthophagus taurus]